MVDLRFTDWPGDVAALLLPHRHHRRGHLRGRLHGLRRLVDPRLAGHQRERHAHGARPETAFIDPFFKHPTLVMICDIVDPITRSATRRDPRYIATKADELPQQSGIGDTAYFGPEAEFFVFSDVRFSTGADTASSASTPSRGQLEHGRRGARGQPRLQAAPRRATSRRPPPTRCRTCAPRWCSRCRSSASRSRRSTTRSRPRVSARST